MTTPRTPAENAEEAFSPLQLRAIAGQVQRWIDWSRSHREAEGLITSGDTRIMTLPVPMWPNHRQMEAWVKALNDGAAALEARDAEHRAEIEAERERCAAIADAKAEEAKQKWTTETDWRQPYAANRVIQCAWGIAAAIRATKTERGDNG